MQYICSKPIFKNQEITYDTVMKRYLSPRCSLPQGGEMPPLCGVSAHTRLIDAVNGPLRTDTGGMRPAPADYILILAGIQPA